MEKNRFQLFIINCKNKFERNFEEHTVDVHVSGIDHSVEKKDIFTVNKRIN